MKIDVAINVTSNAISVKSKAADYTETKPCSIAFSKAIGEDFEVVEDVGGNLTTENIAAAGYERDKGTRTYRVVNPFVPQSFEPYGAFMMIDFLCRKTFYTIKPARGDWRLHFGFDSFELQLQIGGYLLVPVDKKSEFEKLLTKLTKKYQIKAYK
jgi:hypothetical protein